MKRRMRPTSGATVRILWMRAAAHERRSAMAAVTADRRPSHCCPTITLRSRRRTRERVRASAALNALCATLATWSALGSCSGTPHPIGSRSSAEAMGAASEPSLASSEWQAAAHTPTHGASCRQRMTRSWASERSSWLRFTAVTHRPMASEIQEETRSRSSYPHPCSHSVSHVRKSARKSSLCSRREVRKHSKSGRTNSKPSARSCGCVGRSRLRSSPARTESSACCTHDGV
mmetsp:Transcript_21916/g.66570  ORF Transcript_21916/g.66570 Transcript_21916/m.66570 type:complete len:232 (+) Transcript_21916:862-1557(+)|eukprot:scaffold262267_cov36-Tisochrysis_lutea.AAC.1